MYRCKNCGRPINQFDVTFNKQLFPSKTLNEYKCFECTTRGDCLNSIMAVESLEGSYKILNHLLVYIPLALSIIFGVLLAMHCTVISGIDYENFIIFLLVSSIISTLITWIWGARTIIKTFNHNYESFSYSTGKYETTVSSSGSLITKEITEYTDTDHGVAFMEGITFPIWSWIHLIYRLTFHRLKIQGEMYDKCPSQLISAYEIAKRVTKKYVIPKSDINDFIQINKAKEQKMELIRKKYSVIGEEEVERRLKPFKDFSMRTTINKQEYLIVLTGDYYKSTGKNNEYKFVEKRITTEQMVDALTIFALYKDEKGKCKGKILCKNYEVYSEEKEWMKLWKEAEIDIPANKFVDMYSSKL